MTVLELTLVGALILGACVGPYLLLRQGLPWRLAMLLPALGLGGLLLFTAWRDAELTGLQVVIAVGMSASLYGGMLVTWWIYGSKFREHGWRW